MGSKLNDKQITKWIKGSDKMQASFWDCPECFAIGEGKHSDECSRPPMVHRHVTITQFGRCTVRQWCNMLAQKLNGLPGQKCEVKTDTKGNVALFEI